MITHALRVRWSKRGQFSIASGWNGITHQLIVQIGRNDVSIELAVDGMELQTH
jgi:hypothetical protein